MAENRLARELENRESAQRGNPLRRSLNRSRKMVGSSAGYGLVLWVRPIPLIRLQSFGKVGSL
jgi:hypothetical protein